MVINTQSKVQRVAACYNAKQGRLYPEGASMLSSFS